MTLADLNNRDYDGFVAAIGHVCEDSPWVAERAWHGRPFGSLDDLCARLASEIEGATLEDQLALLCAHPDLGTRARIGDSSTREQAGVGLDRLTPAEYERLERLNVAYKRKFGFPFLYAVKGADKYRIMQALEVRLNSDPSDEFAEALRQVYRIVRFRLEEIMPLNTSVNTSLSKSLSTSGNIFASGPKRSYYGKGDVIVYRLNRDGNQPAGANPVFGASVKILIYGDAFWPTYTTGDNTGLVATDSMKNFIQRETLNFTGYDLESYCRFMADKFLDTYPQASGIQVSAVEIPYAALSNGAEAFAPAGPERAGASIELIREGGSVVVAEAKSAIEGFRLLRLKGSAFHGFVRDQYTTLPDIKDRPLHMWLDLNWTYTTAEAAFSEGAVTAQVRSIVREVFQGFESGSIQQIIYQIGEKMLADVPAIGEINLEANNRTWDTLAETGLALGVYTEARPPYGILGLTLKR